MRSAPLYDAVVVTGELAGKGVTCKVRRAGEAGQLFAQQVSSPLINTAAAGAERGRNILADRGEQAAIDLVVPLFTAPLRPGEVGRILPLDLVEVVGEEGTWHGLFTAVRTEARIGEKAVVIEQTITLERHYSGLNCGINLTGWSAPIPYNVWVRSGRVVEVAPNLLLVEVAI